MSEEASSNFAGFWTKQTFNTRSVQLMSEEARSKISGSWTKHTCKYSGLEAYTQCLTRPGQKFIDENPYEPSVHRPVTMSQAIELPAEVMEIVETSDEVMEVS